ncbi:site-specific integrase [Solirhodobacter olei]|uniref:site-specific integrase n=1 Tax=Solirhodobacter olei TaxID=2493082 RepID=UPI003BAC453C
MDGCGLLSSCVQCNPHTRRAYGRAVSEFLSWCELHGIASISAVQPIHVATWIEQLTAKLSVPTVKQRLAAIRHLFEWLRCRKFSNDERSASCWTTLCCELRTHYERPGFVDSKLPLADHVDDFDTGEGGCR